MAGLTKGIDVQYHLAKYGEDLLMEGVGLDAGKYEAIKATLPADIQGKLFGWRNLAMLPHGKGEVFIPHLLDTLTSSSCPEVVGGDL
jgi:hypothetical protein